MRGVNVETVLGLSVTSAGVAWVLLKGSGADAVTLDHDHYSIDAGDAPDISRYEATVRGARGIAEASGHRIRAVGVTFTADCEDTATLLLEALSGQGFDRIAAVPLATATETWAHTYGRTLGFERCALCVVEPAAATVVSVLYNFVRTANTQMRDSAGGIARWLTSVFAVNRSQPETLYLLGSRHDLDVIAGPLEEALPIPVVSSDEAQLSLARGAALSVDAVLAARAQPKPDAQKGQRTGRIPTVRPLVTRFGPHARTAAGIAIGLAGLLAVGATLVGESATPGETSPPPVTAATTPSMSIHSVPSVPAAPMTVQHAAAAPLPAPPPPVVEQTLIEEVTAEQYLGEQVMAEQSVPVEETLPVIAQEAVQPLANTPEPQVIPVALPGEPTPEALPPAAPVAPEVLPPPPPPPPPDPLQAALSPLFSGLP